MKKAIKAAEKRAVREVRRHCIIEMLKDGERSIDKLVRCSGMRRDSVQRFTAKNGYSDLV